MRRQPQPAARDLREPWQIAQAAACGCRGTDDMCPCQNVDRSDPTQRTPTRADLELRIRELEGTIRSLEIQQQTDRQTISSLSGAQGTELSPQLRDRKTPSPEEE